MRSTRNGEQETVSGIPWGKRFTLNHQWSIPDTVELAESSEPQWEVTIGKKTMVVRGPATEPELMRHLINTGADISKIQGTRRL